jgi:flagellar biogenesis protein FliO
MIDITTIGEAFDPMAVSPLSNPTQPKSHKYLWITLLVVIALFAFLWYVIRRDEQEQNNYIS